MGGSDDEIARLVSEARETPPADPDKNGDEGLRKLAATLEKFRVLMALAGNPGLREASQLTGSAETGYHTRTEWVWIVAAGTVACPSGTTPRQHFMAIDPRSPGTVEAILTAARRGDAALLPQDWMQYRVYQGDGATDIDATTPSIGGWRGLDGSCAALRDLVPGGIARIVANAGLEWPLEVISEIPGPTLERFRHRGRSETAARAAAAERQAQAQRLPGHQLWSLIRDFHHRAVERGNRGAVRLLIRTPGSFKRGKERPGPERAFEGWRLAAYERTPGETRLQVTVVLTTEGQVLRLLEYGSGGRHLSYSTNGTIQTLRHETMQFETVDESMESGTFEVWTAGDNKGRRPRVIELRACQTLSEPTVFDEESFTDLVAQEPLLLRITARINHLSRTTGLDL